MFQQIYIKWFHAYFGLIGLNFMNTSIQDGQDSEHRNNYIGFLMVNLTCVHVASQQNILTSLRGIQHIVRVNAQQIIIKKSANKHASNGTVLKPCCAPQAQNKMLDSKQNRHPKLAYEHASNGTAWNMFHKYHKQKKNISKHVSNGTALKIHQNRHTLRQRQHKNQVKSKDLILSKLMTF